jgi:hypothetical protein
MLHLMHENPFHGRFEIDAAQIIRLRESGIKKTSKLVRRHRNFHAPRVLFAGGIIKMENFLSAIALEGADEMK